LTPEEIDQCSYACEIALQRLKGQGRTLDQVLCDPDAAAEFDRYVRSLIAEEISSFRIRWVALHIRKEAKKTRAAGVALRDRQPLPRTVQQVASLDLSHIPLERGLYWLQGSGKKLYVGETLNLRRRFERQLHISRADFWDIQRENLELRYCALPDAEEELLKGNQSRWIADWNPIGNFSELAAL
jgi:hypothetical protein